MCSEKDLDTLRAKRSSAGKNMPLHAQTSDGTVEDGIELLLPGVVKVDRQRTWQALSGTGGSMLDSTPSGELHCQPNPTRQATSTIHLYACQHHLNVGRPTAKQDVYQVQ